MRVCPPRDVTRTCTVRATPSSGFAVLQVSPQGHVLQRDLPLGVCDKTAAALAALGRAELIVTESTWHYPGDGCC